MPSPKRSGSTKLDNDENWSKNYQNTVRAKYSGERVESVKRSIQFDKRISDFDYNSPKKNILPPKSKNSTSGKKRSKLQLQAPQNSHQRIKDSKFDNSEYSSNVYPKRHGSSTEIQPINLNPHVHINPYAHAHPNTTANKQPYQYTTIESNKIPRISESLRKIDFNDTLLSDKRINISNISPAKQKAYLPAQELHKYPNQYNTNQKSSKKLDQNQQGSHIPGRVCRIINVNQIIKMHGEKWNGW